MTTQQKRDVITKAQQFQLAYWMAENKTQLQGWDVHAAASRARKELKFAFTDKTFKNINQHAGIGIQFATSSKHSPMTVIFARIHALEAAYVELCNQVGVTPSPNVLHHMEEK